MDKILHPINLYCHKQIKNKYEKNLKKWQTYTMKNKTRKLKIGKKQEKNNLKF